MVAVGDCALAYFTERPAITVVDRNRISTVDGSSSRYGFPKKRGWPVGARGDVGGGCGGTEVERESCQCEGEKDLHNAVDLLVRFPLHPFYSTLALRGRVGVGTRKLQIILVVELASRENVVVNKMTSLTKVV